MPDIMLNRDIKAVETTIFNPSHQAQLNDVLLYPTVHICGCSIAQDTWDSVIICIEFKLWRYHGKANSSVLMFWFWVCMLCGFTRNGEFWQFSVSSEVCFLLIPTYSCVDGCSAFPQKAMFREEKERAKTGQKKKKKSERVWARRWEWHFHTQLSVRLWASLSLGSWVFFLSPSKSMFGFESEI